MAWRMTAQRTVGGLLEVGFVPGSDLLLLVSSDGLGLLDCSSGERVARDRNPVETPYESVLQLRAIGPAADQLVPLAGLHGGGLPTTTADGWALLTAQPRWPEHQVILQQDFTSLFMEPTQPGRHLPFASRIHRGHELRAAGFSPTGRSLIVADSGSVWAYHRDRTGGA